MALFVPLDVEYWHDEKLVEAGPDGIGDPLAELLYVRALTFCKRTANDGRIKPSQIDSFALRIPQARKRWQYLIASGAVVEIDGCFVLPAWLKRNKSSADIAADKADRALASQVANHQRWHVATGKPNPRCPLCTSDLGSESDPTGDPIGSLEPEGEGEGEAQQQTDGSDATQRAAAAVSIAAAHRCKQPGVNNPPGLRAHLLSVLPSVAERYAIEHPDADAETIAWEALDGPAPLRLVQRQTPTCSTCNGMKVVEFDDGYVQCPECAGSWKQARSV